LAHQAKADFLLIECQSDEREIHRRLTLRAGDQSESSDGRWELFVDQKEEFEKVEDMGPDSHLLLNTQKSVEDFLGVIFQHLLQRAARELPSDLN
jgi:predicted kinase